MELTQELPQPVAPAEPDQLKRATEVPREVEGAFAEAGTLEAVADLTRFVYSEPTVE